MILSARFANAEGTAVILETDDRGSVAISQADTPMLWATYVNLGMATAPYIAPVQADMNLAALNAALAENGSVFRGFVLVMLDEINILRQRAGLPLRTIDQIKPAIQGKM